MNAPKSSVTLPRLPRGLSFELSDLTLVLGWSEFHDLRVVVELDHYTGHEEYEEVLAFYPSNSRFRRWSMWRTHEDIVVQPTQGRTMHFTSVAGALESLIPVSDEAAGPDAT
jgi:hypothetical protein